MLVSALRTGSAIAILVGAPFTFGALIGISAPRIWIAYASAGAGTALMFLTEYLQIGALVALKRTVAYLLLALGITCFTICAAFAKARHSWALLVVGTLGLLLWCWALTRWVDLRMDKWSEASPQRSDNRGRGP
jgi:hypothetical protein